MTTTTKQHIIETASALFYQNGYNSTGVNEIISEANIAKATLYSHFRSKEEICVAYLHHMNTTFISDLKAYLSRQKQGPQRILAIFGFLQKIYNTEGFFGCWCLKTLAEISPDEQNIRQEIQGQKTALIVLIASLLKENMPNYNSTITKDISRKIYLLYESAVAESYLHQKDWPIKEAKKMCQLILEH